MLDAPQSQQQRWSFLGIAQGVLGGESEHTEKSESLNAHRSRLLFFQVVLQKRRKEDAEYNREMRNKKQIECFSYTA